MGIRMLYGAEVSILDNHGKLDLEDEILKHLDYVIASLHRPAKRPGSEEENTRSYIEAMKNPYVRIIGHCDDVKFPVDYLALVEAAMEYHVILELNDSSLRPDGYRGDTRFNDMMLLNLCKHFHYPILLSSDSHGTGHIGNFDHAMELIRIAEFPEELILNRSSGEFLSWLENWRVYINTGECRSSNTPLYFYALFTSTSVSYFSISSNQPSAGTLHLLQYSSQISPIGSVLHSSITTIFFDI